VPLEVPTPSDRSNLMTARSTMALSESGAYRFILWFARASLNVTATSRRA